MPPAKFEPTIPASERPKTPAVDRAATGICLIIILNLTITIINNFWHQFLIFKLVIQYNLYRRPCHKQQLIRYTSYLLMSQIELTSVTHSSAQSS